MEPARVKVRCPQGRNAQAAAAHPNPIRTLKSAALGRGVYAGRSGAFLIRAKRTDFLGRLQRRRFSSFWRTGYVL